MQIRNYRYIKYRSGSRIYDGFFNFEAAVRLNKRESDGEIKILSISGPFEEEARALGAKQGINIIYN